MNRRQFLLRSGLLTGGVLSLSLVGCARLGSGRVRWTRHRRSGLLEQLSDNPAAKMTAQEIAQRVQQAQQQRTAGQAVAAN